jgi:hypothetical protein
MKMLMIVCRDSIEEEVKALLARQHVRAFTELHDVTGTGEAGAAFHSLSWPAFNDMILVALPEAEAESVVAELKAFRDLQIEKQHGAKIPLRVFAVPCDLLV